MARKQRAVPEINAGSMADIAFLLLIFFLVTTSIESDKGLTMTLPPPIKEKTNIPLNERNVLEVLINSQNQLLVENSWMNMDDLCEATKKFIKNEGKDPLSSENPIAAVVSLKNDRGTSYDAYIKVQDELKRAYNEVRDEYSREKFGIPFSELLEDSKQYREVKDKYPQKISEAEPENFGDEK
jgi:biopolymer transport protein ExbD